MPKILEYSFYKLIIMKRFFVIVLVSLFMSAVCGTVSAQEPKKKEAAKVVKSDTKEAECCKKEGEKCDKKEGDACCSADKKQVEKNDKKSAKKKK